MKPGRLLVSLFAAALFPVAANVQAQYRVTHGKGYTFCEEIAKALNKVTPPDQSAACISKTIFSMRGVTQPEWRELKPGEYDPEKIKQIYVDHLIGEQHVMYQRADPARAIPGHRNPTARDVDWFVRQLREGHVKLLVANVDMVITAEPIVETVLQLWFDPPENKGCVGGMPIFVKSDLSGFDEQAYKAAYSIKSGFFLNYLGKPHLIYTSGGDSATVFRRGPDNFCEVTPNYGKIINRRTK